MVELNDKITGGDIGIITKSQFVERLGYAQIGQVYRQVDSDQVKVDFVFTSPPTTTKPVFVKHSTATLLVGSSLIIASKIASLIWSHILSGCPSDTDSLVKKLFVIFIYLVSFLIVIILVVYGARVYAALFSTGFNSETL